MNEMNIPVVLPLDRNTNHPDMVGNCRVDDMVTKPAKADNIANLVAKHMAWLQSNP